MAKYLVVKLAACVNSDRYEDDYSMRYIYPDIIEEGSVVELDKREVEHLHRSGDYRCLEIVERETAQSALQKAIDKAKREAAAEVARLEKNKKDEASREIKRKARAIAKAKALLEKEGQVG